MRRTPYTLLVAVTCLAIGVAVGWLLGANLQDSDNTPSLLGGNESKKSATGEGTETNRQSGTKSHELVDSSPTPATESPASNSNPVVPPTNLPPNLESRIASALSDFQMEPLKGSGTIGGRLLDAESGAPIPGVRVGARRQYQVDQTEPELRRINTTDGIPPKPDIAAAALKTIRDLQASYQNSFHAFSDSEGRFVIRDLPENSVFYLWAYSDEYTFDAEGGFFESAGSSHVRTGGETTLYGTRSREVRITVLLPDGSAPKESVTLRSAPCPEGMEGGDPLTLASSLTSNMQSKYLPGGQGAIRRAPGKYVFEFKASDSEPTFVGPLAIIHDIPESGSTALEVRLPSVNGVRCRVIDHRETESTAGRIGQHTLTYHPWEGEFPPAVPLPTSMGLDSPRYFVFDRKRSPSGPNEQTLKLDGVDPGRYLFVLWHDDRPIASRGQTISGSNEEVVIEVQELARNKYEVLWIRDPIGRLIPNKVWIQHQIMRGETTLCAWRGGRVRPDGALLVEPEEVRPAKSEGSLSETGTHGPAFTKQEMKWSLLISHPEYGKISLDLHPGRGQETTVQFSKPATVLAKIADLPENFPFDELTFVGEVRNESPWDTYESKGGKVFSDHTVRFGPFQPRQEFLLSVSHQNFRKHRRLDLVEHTAMLESGVNVLTIAMPRLFTLTIFTPETPQGARVTISRIFTLKSGDGSESLSAEHVATAEVNADGAAIVPFLLSGKYFATSSGGETEIVEVIGDTSTTLRNK